MILYIIYSTTAMALLLLVYHLFLEKEKMHQFNRWYLMFSILFALTIPFFPVGIGEQLPGMVKEVIQNNQSVSPESDIPADESAYVEGEFYQGQIPVTNRETSSGHQIGVIFLAGYIIVSSALFVRLLRIIYMIQVKANRNTSILLEGCELVLLKEKVVPHTFMNTIFVNKKQFRKGEISNSVFIHELSHVRQKHTIDLLIVEFLKTIFWFNPVLYFYKKAILLNHEYLADQAVIDSGAEIPQYQLLLLNSILAQPTYGLSHSFTFSLTKKRLKMMTKSHSPTRSVLKAVCLIPLFFTLGFFFGCDSTQVDPQTAEKEIHITFTGSELIIVNDESMTVPEFEEMVNELSEDHEFQFFIESHPDMQAGPVMAVNRIVNQYRTVKEDKRVKWIVIELKEAGEIYLDDENISTEQLQERIEKMADDSNLNVNLRVHPQAEMNEVSDVQKLLRENNIQRINYSSIQNDEDSWDTPEPPPIRIINLMNIMISKEGLLLINEQPANPQEVKKLVKRFVNNRGRNPELSESPDNAIISIKTVRETPYDVYTEVLDQIMMAYEELRNQASLDRYGANFAELSDDQQNEIQEIYPKRISIAEPEE